MGWWRRRKRKTRVSLRGLKGRFRQWVVAALASRDAFDDLVEETEDTPLRERLEWVQDQVDLLTVETAHDARRAQDAAQWLGLSRNRSLPWYLQYGETERARTAGTALAPRWDAFVASVRAQLETTRRIRAVYDEAVSEMQADLLRLNDLTARLQEVVFQLGEDAELVAGRNEAADVLEAVRLALDEVDRSDGVATTMPTPTALGMAEPRPPSPPRRPEPPIPSV